MPVTTKRSRKVVPIKGRGGMTGRDGAIDFAAKAAVHESRGRQSGRAHLSGHRVGRHLRTEHRGRHHIGGGACHKTLRHLRWFEVVRTSGHIVDGAVQHYQVTLKVGFTMEDSI